MPLFEYICDECETTFEKLVRSSTTQSDIICPTCSSGHVHKKLSTFATSTGASSGGGSSAASCSTGGT